MTIRGADIPTCVASSSELAEWDLSCSDQFVASQTHSRVTPCPLLVASVCHLGTGLFENTRNLKV